jgi:NADH dehydrogenase
MLGTGWYRRFVSACVVITGANGAIGQAIVQRACGDPREPRIVAAVRSDRAASQVPPIPEVRGAICRVDYERPSTLCAALEGATALVHLPGVLVERRGSSYETANVETTRLALEAAHSCGIAKVVMVSVVGADPGSQNRFFRSKGLADDLVRGSGLAYTILRAPLVLGRGTEGTRALLRETSRGSVRLLSGGRTRHRPLDLEDLAEAVLRSALDAAVARNCVLDLTGPEALCYRDLVERTARARGRTIRVRSFPAAPLRLALALRTWLLGPGLSPDALGVLLTDTCEDPERARLELGIELTPLEVTIRRCLENLSSRDEGEP